MVLSDKRENGGGGICFIWVEMDTCVFVAATRHDSFKSCVAFCMICRHNNTSELQPIAQQLRWNRRLLENFLFFKTSFGKLPFPVFVSVCFDVILCVQTLLVHFMSFSSRWIYSEPWQRDIFHVSRLICVCSPPRLRTRSSRRHHVGFWFHILYFIFKSSSSESLWVQAYGFLWCSGPIRCPYFGCSPALVWLHSFICKNKCVPVNKVNRCGVGETTGQKQANWLGGG